MFLGVHCSVSGGLHNAFTEANNLGIDTFQIFSRNQRQWKAKPISDEEEKMFSSAWNKDQIKTIFTHSSYLINLASINDELQQKSMDALTAELERCEKLGLCFAVLHPGSAKDQTEEEAIRRIARALKEVLKRTSGYKVKVALENTAGQGSSIGRTFEHLRDIMNEVGSERITTCFDTCHAFAAGYDMRTQTGFEAVMEEWDKTVGLNNLAAFHLNDSKHELGSRKDRHEHIGHGMLGEEAFLQVMKHFPDRPKVLETPKKDDMDKVNLKLLRDLISA